jgi:hypothetical protein
MHNVLMVIVGVSMSWMHNAQSTTVDPESIVPLPDKFDMEMPEPDVSPDIARFQGAWIGTWHDDRHILVVERVKPDGHANVVFVQSDSAIYGMNREWWRDQATIADGVLTMTGFRTFRYALDGPDRLYMTATLKSGGVTSATPVRTDATRLAAGDGPIEWPWPGERVWIPHLTVRTPDGTRPIMLEATFYPPAGPGPAPLAIFNHGSDVGRNQLRTWSFSTEAHWLHNNGFAVLALMRRGRGKSEGINGEEDFGRAHDGSLIDVSAGIAQAVEDLESAIAYGRKLALLKRELCRQVKGPEVTHVDRCTLIFDTESKHLYVEREMAHLEANVGAWSTIKQRQLIFRIISSKAVKLLGTASCGGC